MSTQGKRRRIALILATLVLAAAGFDYIVNYYGEEPRIDRLYSVTTLDNDGNENVFESIDYDYGHLPKEGIERSLLARSNFSSAMISVDGKPSETLANAIALPASKLTGQHHYTLTYAGTGGGENGSILLWGPEQDDLVVKVRQLDAHLIAPYEMVDLSCSVDPKPNPDQQPSSTSFNAAERCDALRVDPGHIEVHLSNVRSEDESLVSFSHGASVTTVAPSPTAPTGTPRPVRPLNALVVAATTLLLAGLGAFIGVALTRRFGREWVPAGGGAVDDAWANNTETKLARIDIAKLGTLATTEFAPPRGLTPSEAGVLLRGSVGDDQIAAWFMQAAVDGLIEVDGSGTDSVIHPLTSSPRYGADILGSAFAGRRSIVLGKYDEPFAGAWQQVRDGLNRWKKTSELWESGSDFRVLTAAVPGLLMAAIFGAGMDWSAKGAASAPAGWVVAVGLTALGFGIGISTVVSSGELRRYSPMGSGLWLRTESFRRFLAESEARHIDEAAGSGTLREYTAWAVALGESERWTRAMRRSTLIHQDDQDPFFNSGGIFASTGLNRARNGKRFPR